MTRLFPLVKDWLEVWALFIPLIVLLMKFHQPKYVRPVIAYVIIALILNILSNIIWKFKPYYHFPDLLTNNNHFYNLHSILRFLLFSLFFIQIQQPFLVTAKRAVPLFFILFVLLNFIAFEVFWMPPLISTRLHAVEAGLLLFYCLQYYFFIMKEEELSFKSLPSFWIVTGLGIFVAISFPIYLFYQTAASIDIPFIVNIWQVQKIGYLIFCVFIAKAFYVSNSSKYKILPDKKYW